MSQSYPGRISNYHDAVRSAGSENILSTTHYGVPGSPGPSRAHDLLRDPNAIPIQSVVPPADGTDWSRAQGKRGSESLAFFHSPDGGAPVAPRPSGWHWPHFVSTPHEIATRYGVGSAPLELSTTTLPGQHSPLPGELRNFPISTTHLMSPLSRPTPGLSRFPNPPGPRSPLGQFPLSPVTGVPLVQLQHIPTSPTAFYYL